MKVLSLSDILLKSVYGPELTKLYGKVDFVMACGDLPYYYLEFVVDGLNKAMFFVRGNHDSLVEYSEKGNRTQAWGAIDLHRRVVFYKGIILAGFEGSIRYSRGSFQYTQEEMWAMVLRMLPRFIWNRLRHGRAMDILVTHSPSWDVMDRLDPAHQGFRAFRWLVRVFKPAYHFHGHIHIATGEERQCVFYETKVINTVGAVVTELELNG